MLKKPHKRNENGAERPQGNAVLGPFIRLMSLEASLTRD